MTLEISAEKRLFTATNAEFVEASASIPAVRALRKEHRAFDREWWQSACELGWTSLLVPEELGGGSVSGEGLVDLVSIAELLGAHASPGPLNVVSAVIAALVHPQAEGGHDELIEELMTGEKIASWAVQSGAPAWSPSRPGVSAVATDGGWTLSGRARSVEFAQDADVLLVVADAGDELINVLVDTSADGLTLKGGPSVDFVRRFADLDFAGVHVPASALVSRGRATQAILAHQSRVMNLLQVAEAVGATGKVFSFTVQWGFDRYSFGRPLVSYQALKHRYADDLLWLEASRAILAAATTATQNGAPEAQKLVSSAKSYVGERSVEIVQDCVQLHGGLGVTLDHDLNVYLRRVMLARQLYGTPREHREIIADLIQL